MHGWKGGRGETWVVVSQNFQVAAMDLARLELRRERERLDASLSCCVGAALSSLPNLWADRKVAECASRSRSPSLSEAMGWCKILGALAHYLRPTERLEEGGGRGRYRGMRLPFGQPDFPSS